MTGFSPPLVAVGAGTAVLLGTHAALAHGPAATGALSGHAHPCLGLDPLVLLLAVGGAASLVCSHWLRWALGGACIGAVIGFTEFSLPWAKVLASLPISVIALVTLLTNRNATTTTPAAVSVHALLHGLEASPESNSLLWWSGALFSPVLVCGSRGLSLPTSGQSA